MFLAKFKQTVTTLWVPMAAVVAVEAGIAKWWEGAPWWAYIVIPGSPVLIGAAVVGLVWLYQTVQFRRLNRSQFPYGTTAAVCKSVRGLLSSMTTEKAGLQVSVYDSKRIKDWVDRVIKNLYELLKQATPDFPDDAYVIWLAEDKAPDRLIWRADCKAPESYRTGHTVFEKGEGMAGKVWATGETAAHSASAPHPNWETWPGCENQSYVCVCVGKAGGPAGVLGFGSDKGFRTNKAQETIMETFAAILALAGTAKPRDKGGAPGVDGL